MAIHSLPTQPHRSSWWRGWIRAWWWRRVHAAPAPPITRPRHTHTQTSVPARALTPAPTPTPALAALIEKGSRKGNVVTGSVTLKELKAVSAWIGAANTGRENESVKIAYTLTLSSAGLVSRVRTSFTLLKDGELNVVTVDSRYTGWGGKVSIKAPAPGSVTTEFR